MRIRRKKWAAPELNAADYFIQNPYEQRGKWSEVFARQNPLHLEIGCGRGGFISQMAIENPDINYLAVDIKLDMLGTARRNIEKIFTENQRDIDNIKLTVYNMESLKIMLTEQDKVERMYINFCNPWYKSGDKKHRLTHTRQLMRYKEFLTPQAEIWFKTDDAPLFEESLEYFDECGFKITYITRDLHNSDFVGSIPTEHEKMFTEQGIPTKFLIAVNQ
ncbi:MAG: tRNA (guanosine(46)-N7)-methyltransferase TrmB [Oscillospiraceae bacterium]